MVLTFFYVGRELLDLIPSAVELRSLHKGTSVSCIYPSSFERSVSFWDESSQTFKP